MKKIILLLSVFIIFNAMNIPAQAISTGDKNSAAAVKRVQKSDTRQIKDLFKLHERYANNHDISSLGDLYSEKYVNNDGFDKKIYFQSIKDTWETCKDLTYKTTINKISIDGDYASVEVLETAYGSLYETLDIGPVAGEIHSTSTGIYHLTKNNGKWLITGETALTDNSSLRYGDARYLKIELSTPNQVNFGEQYTATVKIDADENTFVIGSIGNDPVKYPPSTPNNTLRAVPQSQTLERILYANQENLNEYTVATLAVSKIKDLGVGGTRVSLTGLACLMKRVNVVPKNNYITQENPDENNNR